jgi:hypothetical protein
VKKRQPQPMSFDSFIRSWHKSQEPFWKQEADKEREYLERLVEEKVFGKREGK